MAEEEKDLRVKEQIELKLYKDERNNWRYGCDKLQISGAFCPRIFAEELDRKYGSITDMPAWLVVKLNKMKHRIHAVSLESNNFTSGWNAAIKVMEETSEEVPRIITRSIETVGKEVEEKNEKDQTIRISFPESESEEESETYNGAIYETLKPNDCYLITKKGDSVLVVTNKDGKIEVKWVLITNEDDAMAAIHAIGAGRAIGAGITTLLKMISALEEKKEKELDITSNPLTGKTESHDDSTSNIDHFKIKKNVF